MTNNTQNSPETETHTSENGFYLTEEEHEEIQRKLVTISDYQRLSSLILWLGLAMVILHIGADIFFHVLN